MQLSIVIPLFNEEQLVAPLIDEIKRKLRPLEGSYKIILVNDGSTDHTDKKLRSALKKYPQFIQTVSYSKNQGQGLALWKGFREAKGDYIAIIDGDMQFDPKDILVLYRRLVEGKYDLVCGQRRDRQDPVFSKIIPSRVGNWIICRAFGVRLNDLGCALKIGSRKMIFRVRPFKNYHRYLALLLIRTGAKYCEMEVTHRKRLKGKTKYSLSKIFGIIKEVFMIRFVYRFE